MQLSRAVLLIALPLVALGCAVGPESGSPTPPASAEPSPTEAPAPSGTFEVPPAIIQPMLEAVSADSGAQIAQIIVERAQRVTWPDGSLGCPEPGVMYIQALIDGYWVVLSTADTTYDFRADSQGSFRLCPAGQGRPPLQP